MRVSSWSDLSRRLVVAVVAALLLASCSGDDAPAVDLVGAGLEDPREGGTLVDVHTFPAGEPQSIDPALADDVGSHQVAELLFDGLTVNDFTTGDILPGVARSWESDEDGDRWTFRLRDDVLWSDGEPVRASDFKYAWERVLRPELASSLAYHFNVIEGSAAVLRGDTTDLSGVVADDEAGTLTVQLTTPYSPFPIAVAHTVFSPVPAHVVEALADPVRWDQGPMVGNGPFVLAEPWQHDRYIEVVRNDRYYGGPSRRPPHLDAVQFRIGADVSTSFQQFEAGQADVGRIPPGRYEDVLETYADQHLTDPTIGVYYFAFDMQDPLVGGDENRPLRQAIALAIDKDTINEAVYDGSRTVATGWTPPGVAGYQEDLEGDRPEEQAARVAAARALLDDWEGRLAEPLRMSYIAGTGHDEVVAIIQADLEEIGIETTLDPRPGPTYFDDMTSGEGEFFFGGWVWDYVAYDSGMYPLFHSASIGADNVSRYSNPEVDNLIEQARAETDAEESQELYRLAERIVLEDAVVVPITWYNGAVVHQERVQGLTQSPLQYLSYQDAWIAE